MKIPVCPVSSVELIGLEASAIASLPVICTVKSIKDTAYVALYSGKLLKLKYGILKEVVQEMTADLNEFIVAGAHRAQLIELLSDKKIQDSGVQFANAKFLIEKSDLFNDRAVTFPLFAHPITEQSIFV